MTAVIEAHHAAFLQDCLLWCNGSPLTLSAAGCGCPILVSVPAGHARAQQPPISHAQGAPCSYLLLCSIFVDSLSALRLALLESLPHITSTTFASLTVSCGVVSPAHLSVGVVETSCYMQLQVPALSPSFEGKQRVKTWLSRLNAKPAHYELTPDEARQLEHDISTSFSEFNDCLETL